MELPGFTAFKFSTGAESCRDIVVATFFITFFYILTGKLALLLALPPGYATAIFPPAGIALGAAFIVGRLSLPGIFLGSLLLNLWVSRHLPMPQNHLTAYLAATLIATASTLQAEIGGGLLRRLLRYPCVFDKARDINLFLLSAPVICLVSAGLSIAGLFVLGVFDRANAMANWLTWWLGDTMGVLIAFPIVMVLAGEPRKLWRQRRFVIAVPMLALVALFVFAFIEARRWEEFESLNYLRTQIGWQSWTVLTLGLFSTGLLGALLMLSSGHTARVEMEVEQHVRALRESAEKLRVSEERWQFALEGSGDGVWDVDLQTREMFLSRQNMAMLGYDSDACRISVDEWHRRMHPDDLVRTRDVVVEYIRGKSGNYVCDFRTLTKDGQWCWLRSRGKLIDARATGGSLRMIGTHTNIDREKHNEFKELLHGEVMEMLASARGNHKLTDVLEKITGMLQAENSDLTYAAFTARQSNLSMGAGNRFAANLRAREIPLDNHQQTGGTAILAGVIVRVPLPSGAFSQYLTTLATDAGFTLCWAESVLSPEGCMDGALVAFRCNPDSTALPDLDYLRHAARLMGLAIRRKYFDEQLQLIASVYEVCSEAIMVTDADTHIVTVNPAFTAITGFSAAEVVGRDSKMLRSNKNKEVFKTIVKRVSDTGFWKGEYWMHRKTGEDFPISATVNTIYNENSEAFRRICLFSDITDKKIAEEQLQHLASHDALTELPNRMLFRDRLQRALVFAQRENNLFALMYIDLDHFKPVNDNLGHLAGDQLLRAAADRMRACVRESDTVARIGGDEFAVLLPMIKSMADAQAIGEKIRKSLSEAFEIVGQKINISASIGVAALSRRRQNGA